MNKDMDILSEQELKTILYVLECLDIQVVKTKLPKGSGILTLELKCKLQNDIAIQLLKQLDGVNGSSKNFISVDKIKDLIRRFIASFRLLGDVSYYQGILIDKLVEGNRNLINVNMLSSTVED